MKRRMSGLASVLSVWCAALPLSASAANLYQDFETWDRVSSIGYYLTNGWEISSGRIRGPGSFVDPFNVIDANACALGDWPTYTNAWLRTPLLTNGAGTFTLWLNTARLNANNEFVIEWSTNLVTWVLKATGSVYYSTAYSQYQFAINEYDNGYLRIRKTNDNTSSVLLGIDNVSVTNPPARVLMGDPYTSPSNPVVGRPTDVFIQLWPSQLASNLAVTCFWQTASTPWTPIRMTNTGGNLFKTQTPIPAQPTPVNVYYAITVWFSGNDPMSPTNSPAEGTNNPHVFACNPRTLDSAYEQMETTLDFATNLLLVDDYQWQGVFSSAAPVANGQFRFRGINSEIGVTNILGDFDQDDFELPVSGRFETNGNPIVINGTNTGQFVFHLNETNCLYSVRRCFFRDFEDWPGAGFVTETNAGWVICNAAISNDTGKGLRGSMCVLNSNSSSYIRSPYLPDGIGEISFYFRNWEETGSPAGGLLVQKSYTGGGDASEWVTIATLPDITSTNFGRYVLRINDRYGCYARIATDTGMNSAAICLDEVLFAHAGAGAVMSNQLVIPERPAYSDPVVLRVSASERAGASNLILKAYYRTYGSNTYQEVPMTHIGGGVYETAPPVPAGQGHRGWGVGTVEYYFRCWLDGFESELAEPISYPENGAANPFSYEVIPAQVVFSNVVTDPAVPVAGSNVTVSADILPVAGADYLSAWLYYRIGNSGSFTGVFMDEAGTSKHFVAVSPIPAQTAPGTLVQYFITVEYLGPEAMSPTNFPTEGASSPLWYIVRSPPLLSGYTNLYARITPGNFTQRLDRILDNQWLGVLRTNQLSSPQFRFHAENASVSTNWGENNQSIFSMPVFGAAEGGAVSNISASGLNSGPYFAFRFNETNREYSIQKECAFVAFDEWSDPDAGFGTYTNTEGWVVSNCRTTTNSPADLGRTWRGRSCVMNSSGSQPFIRSPFLSNGVGEIHFWYRNGNTNGFLPAGYAVQVSGDGISWRTVAQSTNVMSVDYLHFSHTLADTSKHYLRILCMSNAPRAELCLDEILVAEPGPRVSFTNVTITPPSPTIADTVTLTVSVALDRATSPALVAWYRPGTNGEYSSTPMTHIGGGVFRTDPPVPGGPIGTMQFYFECGFIGMRSGETVYQTHPVDGDLNPLSYTNTDFYLWQDFETWPLQFTTGCYTNGGWVANEAMIRTASGAPSNFYVRGARAGCLEDHPSYTNSWIRSPMITGGVGKISFWASTPKTPGTNYFSAQVSTNGISWETIGSAWHSATNYTNCQFHANLPDIPPAYVRILKTGDDQVSEWLGIDDISISLAPAQVTITNVMIHPGYPSSNEPVYVSCVITSATRRFPAMNITARTYYRVAGAGVFQGPLEMERSGDTFTTVSPIPPMPEKTVVEYYIESRFQGYCHDPSESRSPSYSPAGAPSGGTNQYYSPPSTYHSYTVRPHASSYSNILIAIEGTNIAASMTQYGDSMWQGVVFFTNAVNGPMISLKGVGFYTGTNYCWTWTNTWGDTNQLQTDVPLSGTMDPSAPGLQIPGTALGQYLVRFNETDLSYTLQRCVFQNFDEWRASSVYFERSLHKPGISLIAQDFDSWQTNTESSIYEDFESWPACDYVFGEWDGGTSHWVTEDALITNQVGSDKACQLYYMNTYGKVRTSVDNMTDGLGYISLLYRCVDTNNPPVYYSGPFATNSDSIMVKAYIMPYELPVSYSPLKMGLWWLGIYARFVDQTNWYQLRIQSHPDNINLRRLSLIRNRNGTETLLATNDVSAGAFLTNAATVALFVSTSGSSSNRTHIEAFYDGQRILMHDDTGPDVITNRGSVGFNAQDAGILIDNVLCGGAQVQAFSDWTNSNPLLVSTNGEWIAYYAEIQNGLARITTNRAGFLCQPNVRSGFMPHGVSNLQWRCWKDAAGPNALLRIQRSATGGPSPGEWTDVYTNVISGVSPQTFSIFADITNAVYLRFLNDTNADGTTAVLDLDDIAAEPHPRSAFYDTFAASPTNWSDPFGKWSLSGQAYRCPGYNGSPLTFRVQVTPLENRDQLGNDALWTTITIISNCNNTAYQALNPYLIGRADPYFLRVRHLGGAGSLVLDNIRVTSWHGAANSDTNGWYAAESWVTAASAWSTNSIELRKSRAYSNALQYVMSPVRNNGIGVLSLRNRSLTGDPVSFEVQYATATDGLWTTVFSWTNNATDWMSAQSYVECNVNQAGTKYVRIVHTSTNQAACLLLDDISLTDYLAFDDFTWEAYNALITHSQTNRLLPIAGNVKGAYLNKDGTTGIAPGASPYTNDMPYIQTAFLTNGIGEVSFWYRNWGGGYPPAAFLIKAAPTPTNPPSTWKTLYAVSNINNETFRLFSMSFYEPTNRYLRICCQTAAGGRLCLDDVLVTAPYAADLKLRNLRTDPVIPLNTNQVHVSVDLYDFTLQPIITNVTLYYRTGISPWGSWPAPYSIPMMLVATNAGYRTYRTATPIPAKAVDTIVQYNVQVAFYGLFSDKTSPKRCTTFVNPSWYYPVDLNEGKSELTPYYIVFSCLPGAVWINEVNYKYRSDESTNEYVEICGPAGVQIKDWRIELVDTLGERYDYCVITNFYIPHFTNGFGFIVFGDPEVRNVNYVFTNPVSQNLQQNGGVRLVRSMGAYEQRLCYGASGAAMTNMGYQYIGEKNTSLARSPLYLQGTGSTYSNFTWTYTVGGIWYSPGRTNAGQNLLGTYVPPPEPVFIVIQSFTPGPSTNWLVFGVSGASGPISAAPIYSTNLLSGLWYAVTNVSTAVSGNVYTQWWRAATSSPVYFYAVSTNF